jgi:hypothetical protein
MRYFRTAVAQKNIDLLTAWSIMTCFGVICNSNSKFF